MSLGRESPPRVFNVAERLVDGRVRVAGDLAVQAALAALEPLHRYLVPDHSDDDA